MHWGKVIMILKRLIEEYNFNVETILLRESKRLKLSLTELHVLLALFSIAKKRKTFSVSAISRRIDFNQNEIGSAVDSLIEKEYIIIKLEKKDQKEREVFDLDPILEQIENLFKEDHLETVRQQNEALVMITITQLEERIGRPLKSLELDAIRSWYEENLYEHSNILTAIEQSGDRPSVKFVEQILNQMMPEPVELDQEVEDVLDNIYKQMR